MYLLSQVMYVMNSATGMVWTGIVKQWNKLLNTGISIQFFINTPVKISAVSYTHIDVYKRQVMLSPGYSEHSSSVQAHLCAPSQAFDFTALNAHTSPLHVDHI